MVITKRQQTGACRVRVSYADREYAVSLPAYRSGRILQDTVRVPRTNIEYTMKMYKNGIQKVNNNGQRYKDIKRTLKKAIAVAILLAVWQAAAMLLDQGILLASPADVLVRIFALPSETGFWSTAAYTFARISLGFIAGLCIGVLLAILAARSEWVEILLSPLMVTIRTVPVASFIILALIWISTHRLSSFIAFLMVLPVIYNNVLQGIRSVDVKLNQMADVYHLSAGTRIKYIWAPAIQPFLISACETGLGLAWKAGVAAEVIGIPAGSIGEQMYMSKIYLDSAGLFAWTVVIVVISVLCEKLVLWLIRRAYVRLCGCG